MSIAGCLKSFEFLVRTDKEFHVTTEFCQNSTAGPMPGITVIILTATIVKHGEQLDYPGIGAGITSKLKSVSAHTHPVGRPMRAPE
jgi:hypothetical protein